MQTLTGPTYKRFQPYAILSSMMDIQASRADNQAEQRTRERLQTLYVINDMLKQAEADGLDIQVILPRVLQVAALELNAATGSIIVVKPSLDVEHAWVIDAESEYSSNYAPFLKRVMKDGLAGVVYHSRQALLIPDTSTSPLWLPREGHPTESQSWSAICAPLITRNRVIGTLTLTKPGIGRFSDDDINLLTAIGSQAASTIENARLFQSAQHQLKITRLLNKASQVINSSLDLKQIMQSLLTQMNELFHAEALSIALASPDGSELVFEVAEGEGSEGIIGLRIPANQGISGWVLASGEAVMVNDVESDVRFSSMGDQRSGITTEAMICAPLKSKGTVIGTIQVLNPRDTFFSDDDLDLLINLANLAGTAFANAKQFTLTQAAEARYTGLFEDSIDPIILTDKDGRIKAINQRVIELLAYDSAELIGKSIDSLHHGSITDTVLHTASQNGTIENGKQPVIIRDRHAIIKNGGEIPVEVHFKLMRMYDEQIIQWIYHDISQQAELEKMRRDLTAMLYHDLQNPLTNIIASLELLDMELSETLDPVSLSMLDVATRSSQRLRHLIRSLLDINQFEAGMPIREWNEVSVDNIVQYVDDMMGSQFRRRHIDFDIDVTPDLPLVNVNTDMIQRVLINLLDNAFKYSEAGDTVTLAVRHNPDDPAFLLAYVADQGPGIPEKHRDAVFEKFFRTPNSITKGIGLGLAFCRLTVEAHGGKIWVSKAKGGGAQFNFTLPIAQQK